jgi:hypothetical protein
LDLRNMLRDRRDLGQVLRHELCAAAIYFN